jgi:hypothetical protein
LSQSTTVLNDEPNNLSPPSKTLLKNVSTAETKFSARLVNAMSDKITSATAIRRHHVVSFSYIIITSLLFFEKTLFAFKYVEEPQNRKGARKNFSLNAGACVTQAPAFDRWLKFAD